jgi:hypothetical protein
MEQKAAGSIPAAGTTPYEQGVFAFLGVHAAGSRAAHRLRASSALLSSGRVQLALAQPRDPVPV